MSDPNRAALDLLECLAPARDPDDPSYSSNARTMLPSDWDDWTHDERSRFVEALCVTEAERAIRDRLFWQAVDRGLATGAAAWGKLYSDLRGWTGRATGAAADPTAADRLTPEQADALIRAVTDDNDNNE